MISGTYRFEHLSEGLFDLYTDGSLSKNEQAATVRKSWASEDMYADLSQQVGIDPILVTLDQTNILLDAGMGFGLNHKNFNPAVSNLRTNLDIFGLSPEDIDHVVLTHLHYDHIAGLTYTDISSKVRATLPNASIWVQRAEWEYALANLDNRDAAGDLPYQLDDFYRLVADGQVHFLDTPATEIIPGLEAIRTGGHTPGHQMVRISHNNQKAYYFGDLIPNEHFLGFRMVPDADYDVTASRQLKMLLLKQAHLEDAQVLFYHSVHLKHGKLSKDQSRQFVVDTGSSSN